MRCEMLTARNGSSICSLVDGSLWRRLELQSVEKRRGRKRLQLLRNIENAWLLRQNGIRQPLNRLWCSGWRGKAITLRFGLGRG